MRAALMALCVLAGCGEAVSEPAAPAPISMAQCEALIRAADVRAVGQFYSRDAQAAALVRRGDQKADLYVDRTGRIAVVGEVAADYFDASRIRYVLTTDNVMLADFARSPNARLNDARRNVILGDNRLVCTLYD